MKPELGYDFFCSVVFVSDVTREINLFPNIVSYTTVLTRQESANEIVKNVSRPYVLPCHVQLWLKVGLLIKKGKYKMKRWFLRYVVS